jgi:hypothetical protein
VRNPIIPQTLFDLMTDTDGDGMKDYYFTRRLSEFGNRGNVADRDTFRIATGLKGTFLKAWDYDAYVAYGATKESQVSGGQVNVLNFRNALESVPDVNDVNGNGNTTEAICRDANARAQGCVPINIFGFNSIIAGRCQVHRHRVCSPPSRRRSFTAPRCPASPSTCRLVRWAWPSAWSIAKSIRAASSTRCRVLA